MKEGHDLLWPSGLTPTTGPTLLTGVKMGEADHLIDKLMEWERKFESANLQKHKQFPHDAQLAVGDNPLEATAWENGYVPEAEGLPSDRLDFRIQSLLPPLAYMVSRPRQPVTVGEELLRRFDAGVRPYWLRDWQSGFGGYTKVYEYQVDGETRRQFFVAHVVRPRTKSSNACLCFTLMSKMPDQKPWKRPTISFEWCTDSCSLVHQTMDKKTRYRWPVTIQDLSASCTLMSAQCTTELSGQVQAHSGLVSEATSDASAQCGWLSNVNYTEAVAK